MQNTPHVCLRPVTIARDANELCLIEPSINSVRVSARVPRNAVKKNSCAALSYSGWEELLTKKRLFNHQFTDNWLSWSCYDHGWSISSPNYCHCHLWFSNIHAGTPVGRYREDARENADAFHQPPRGSVPRPEKEARGWVRDAFAHRATILAYLSS